MGELLANLLLYYFFGFALPIIIDVTFFVVNRKEYLKGIHKFGRYISSLVLILGFTIFVVPIARSTVDYFGENNFWKVALFSGPLVFIFPVAVLVYVFYKMHKMGKRNS